MYLEFRFTKLRKNVLTLVDVANFEDEYFRSNEIRIKAIIPQHSQTCFMSMLFTLTLSYHF